MSINKSYPQGLNSEAIAEIQWGAERPGRFLSAWKKGVKLIGQQYFNATGDIDNITDKWDLKPDKELVEHSLHKLSTGQAIFLAAMYSFYNSGEGQLYLEQLECPNISDISSKLDKKYLEVISKLFMNYSGW